MGRMSRTKGKRGELEICAMATAAGFKARRTAPLQAAQGHETGDVSLGLPALHIEVKRDEHKSVDAMVRQAESDAPDGKTPVVIWRRNNQPWRVVLPIQEWLDLVWDADKR